MTIRKGESHIIGQFSDFRAQLNASWSEVAQSLPSEQQQMAVNIENELRFENDRSPVEDLESVHHDIIQELALYSVGSDKMIQRILNARDEEYVHLYENPAADNLIHRIIELYSTSPPQ